MLLSELLSDAQAFQLFLDRSKERFDVPVWSQFLTDQYVNSLSWKALGGAVLQVAAGTIKDFSADKPVKTRPDLSKAEGEIPSMGDQWQLSPRKLRDMLDIAQTASIVSGNQTQLLLDYLFPEIKKASLAPQKRLDWILLQSLSTGQVVVDTTSNPDGLVWTIDWSISHTHAGTAAWAVGTTTSVPVTDFRTIIASRRSNGIPTEAILMNQNTWDKMVSSSQITGVFGVRIPTNKNGEMTISPVSFITKDLVNTYFAQVGLPPIMIIDVPIRIESSKGTSTSVQGFADDRVAFVPSLNLGELQWTYANEQRIPDKKKTYGTVNNVMIAQFLEKANFFTEYEFNAFPVLTESNMIQLLVTNSTS